MKTPEYIPTPAQAALDAEVERRRARLAAAGQAGKVERLDSAVGGVPDNVVSVADVIPEAVAVFRGLQERMAAFYAEMRPKVARAPQTIECEIHGGTLRPIDFDLTCSRSREAGEFSPEYAPCAVCAAETATGRKRDYWRRHGAEERNIEASFKTFATGGDPKKEKALAAVRGWAKRRSNFLLLMGGTGTGKGFLAMAALRANGAGIFIKQVDMLADLRASYTTHTTEALVRTWQEAEMLCLDEFGLSMGGKDEEPLLYQVLADRYDKRRPTIITSNLDRPALREAMGYRIVDRIREDCVEVVMTWESYRSGK